MKKQLAIITMSVALATTAAQAQYAGYPAPAGQVASAPVHYGATAAVRRGAQARTPQHVSRPVAYTASRGPIAPQAQRGPVARVASNQGYAVPARTPLVAQAANYGAQPYGYGGGAQAPLAPIPQGSAGAIDGGYSDGCPGDGYCGGGCGKKEHGLWCNFFWFSTKDMPQHMPYFPNAHGYYYFHPYNLIHVQQQQEMMSRWGQDPRNTQDNRFFERIYQEQEAIQTQDAIRNEAMISYPLR